MTNNFRTGLRAALMSRVSTDEQTKGHSLDVQSEGLQKYCAARGIEIAYEFQDHYSAKTFNRPAFSEFLNLVKSKKINIDLLLFTTWDRFSRNIRDALIMIERLKKLGITVDAIQQPLDLRIPENMVSLSVYLALPQVDNDRRSIKVSEGMRAAAKSGRWCVGAPVGYTNARDEKNKPIIVPNEKAKYVKYTFEQASRNVPQAEIRQALKKQGFIVPRNSMSEMLRKHVYMGKILLPKTENEPEQLIDGIHEPIISEALFYKVQSVLNTKKGKSNRPNVNRRRDELPLRGNLLCSKCGSHLTGSASRGHMGKRYFYYHCNNCKTERFPAVIANDAVKEILSLLKLTANTDKLVEAIVQDKVKQKAESIPTSQVVKKISDLKTRLYNLQDMLADRAITVEEYSTMKSRYESEKLSLENNLNQAQAISTDSKTKLRQCIALINNLDIMFENADLAQKNKILSSTFPEKLIFDGKKCRTSRINEILYRALNNDGSSLKRKTGQLSKKLELSGQVVPRGIEPLLQE